MKLATISEAERRLIPSSGMKGPVPLLIAIMTFVMVVVGAAGLALANTASVVKAGVEQRASARPYVVRGPVTLEMSFKHYRAAELLAYLPIVTRVNAHTIRFVGRDILEVSKFIEFVNSYSPDITP